MTTDISVNVRWDPQLQQDIIEDLEYDGGNSSSRLFERSRIKALAGKIIHFLIIALSVSIRYGFLTVDCHPHFVGRLDSNFHNCNYFWFNE